MGEDGLAPGSARLHLVDGLPLLRPDEQVFETMIRGWRNQQLARNLSPGYVDDQERTVRAFTRHADAMPWQWTPQHIDEWSADLRAVHGRVRSALHNYQGSVRQFRDFLTSPAYGWADECLRHFGTHPVQVVYDWNAAAHADEEVLRVRGRGPRGLAAGLPGRHHRGRSAAGKDLVMPRQISYRWLLRELMAARGMFTAAELMPHLAERGITLSSRLAAIAEGEHHRLLRHFATWHQIRPRRPHTVRPGLEGPALPHARKGQLCGGNSWSRSCSTSCCRRWNPGSTGCTRARCSAIDRPRRPGGYAE